MAGNRGSELRALREIAGLSQYELSKLAPIPRNRISLFECGYIELRDDEYGLAVNVIRDEIQKRRKLLKAALYREIEPHQQNASLEF